MIDRAADRRRRLRLAGADRRRAGRPHPRHRAGAAARRGAYPRSQEDRDDHPERRRADGRRDRRATGRPAAPARRRRRRRSRRCASRSARARRASCCFAARGTSDHAALYAKYLAEIQLGLPAGLASPSTLTVYGSRPDLRDVLFVAVSQSGGSPDLVDSLTAARDCGALTVAVTNDAVVRRSPQAADLQRRRARRAGARGRRDEDATPPSCSRCTCCWSATDGTAGAARLRPRPPWRPRRRSTAAARYRFADRLITTARGYSYPTAREAALKLMETSYISAQAFSAADLLHGPLAMIDCGMPVIAVVSPGRGGDAMSAALDRLADDRRRCAARRPVRTDVPVAADGIPERPAAVLEILPLQQLAWRLALDRGTDPDHPRGLAKVTSTW